MKARLSMMLVLLAWLSLPASANEVWQAKGSGVIDIASDGSVTGFRLDDSLGNEMDAFVGQQVEAWRFEPVIEGGQAIPVQAKVYLTLQAVPKGETMQVRVTDAMFFELVESATGGEPEVRESTKVRMPPPAYPPKVLKASAGGTVVLVLDISRDGRVANAEVERLDVIAESFVRSSESRKLAGDLERAVRAVLPEWRFRPERLDFNEEGIARVRVPVSFGVGGMVWGRLYSVIQPPVREAEPEAGMEVADFDMAGKMASPRISLETALEPLPGS